MSNTIPRPVLDILQDQLGIYPPSILKLDSEGTILDTSALQANFRMHPEIGDSIERYVEALNYIFPYERTGEDLVETLELTNMEFKNQQAFTIYLIFTPTDVWAVFVETTETVSQLKRVFQKYNETMLKQSSQPAEVSRWGSLLLKSLGYTCYEHIEGTYFKLLGKPADWALPVLGYIHQNRHYIDLVDHHPFLDVFLTEAEAFWNSPSGESLESGIWLEQDEDGKNYAFKAIATHPEQARLLLLGPAENSVDNLQELIQTARERSLDIEELNKAKASLQKLIAFKNQFVSIISHDLRAPITSVITLLKLLIDGHLPKKGDTRTHKDFLLTAQSELEKVLAYNEKIYEWTNLELGRFHIELEWINLDELLNGTIHTFKDKFRKKGVTIASEFGCPVAVHVDQVMFPQAINNLIGNALKFTPKKGRVTVTTKLVESGLKIVISDTGVGMNPSAVEDAFSGYHTHHTGGTSGEIGSGLGLGICKKITDIHGFHIEISSKVGMGTSVSILLPEEAMKKIDGGKRKAPRKKFLRFF
jgi:signal transduction histidine kinase